MAKLTDINLDVNVRLWGPRPYTERSAEDGMPRFDFTVPVKRGSSEAADIEVEKVEYGDGEIDYMIRCLCHACETLENGDPMDVVLKDDPPGIYYMRAWYERFPATVNGPEEYDAGWEIAPHPGEEDQPPPAP
jgi:hypothetical protein